MRSIKQKLGLKNQIELDIFMFGFRLGSLLGAAVAVLLAFAVGMAK